MGVGTGETVGELTDAQIGYGSTNVTDGFSSVDYDGHGGETDSGGVVFNLVDMAEGQEAGMICTQNEYIWYNSRTTFQCSGCNQSPMDLYKGDAGAGTAFYRLDEEYDISVAAGLT